MSKKVLLTATVQSHICQFHRPLVNVLHRYGYEVHVAARNNLEEKNGLKLDFVDKIYEIPFARSPFRMNNIRAYHKLKKILASENYAFIHCNTPVGGVVTRLAARKERKKGCTVIYTAHGFHFYEGAPLKNWMLFYPLEILMAHFTDKLITVNSEDYRLAVRKFKTSVYYMHGVGVDAKRYCLSDDRTKTEKKKKMGFEDNQKIILNIGELLPNKNQKMAIHAMRKVVDKYPDTVLLIAGNGPEKVSLEKEISDYRLSGHVILLGYCTNLEDYQNIADLLITCSIREGLPLNVIEAMLSANPVVATSNRGHRDLIEDGYNGYLVEPNQDEEMANKIIELLACKRLREKLGANARQSAERFSVDAVQAELEKIYFDSSAGSRGEKE